MIHFRMVGQFANQALQFVLARILADKTGLAYNAPAGFRTKDGDPLEWTGEPLFTMQSAPGRHADGIPQIIDAWQYLDLDSIDPNRPVIVRQWFGQRYEILKPYRDRIRNEWLKIPPERFVVSFQDCVVVHVRRDDYIEYQTGRMADPMFQGTATTAQEYLRCLKEFPQAKWLWLVSDASSDDPFCKELRATLRQETGLDVMQRDNPWDIDFLTLASARWVILSQSTYSWLAAFLGRAEKIVAPVFPGTFWGNGVGLQGPQSGPGGRDFPNLFVDDEPGRWVWLRGDDE